MHAPLPFNPNNGVPILGQQQQMQMLGAQVVITPQLLKKLEAWSKRTGIPFNEIGQTIFRMGLIGFSMNFDSQDPLDVKQAIECIPLTDNEKNSKFE